MRLPFSNFASSSVLSALNHVIARAPSLGFHRKAAFSTAGIQKFTDTPLYEPECCELQSRPTRIKLRPALCRGVSQTFKKKKKQQQHSSVLGRWVDEEKSRHGCLLLLFTSRLLGAENFELLGWRCELVIRTQGSSSAVQHSQGSKMP